MRRAAAYHAGAVECIDADPVKGGVVAKLVHRQVIGVGPQGELRIIPQECWVRRIHLHGVEKPTAADGVAGLGHTDALVK